MLWGCVGPLEEVNRCIGCGWRWSAACLSPAGTAVSSHVCVHASTTPLLAFTSPPKTTQVTDSERAVVKQIVYGLSYGMGPGRVAAALGIPELKARELCEDFKGSHPSLTAWMEVRVGVGGWGVGLARRKDVEQLAS